MALLLINSSFTLTENIQFVKEETGAGLCNRSFCSIMSLTSLVPKQNNLTVSTTLAYYIFRQYDESKQGQCGLSLL